MHPTTTSISLPCPQLGRFWQSLYQRKRLYLLGHFEDEFHFLIIYEFKSSRQHINKDSQKGEYLTRRPLLQVAGSHVSKFLNLNVSGTNRDVVPKQRYDRFPSVGDHIHATTTFEHAWATPGQTVIGVSQKCKEQYRFLRAQQHSNCNI